MSTIPSPGEIIDMARRAHAIASPDWRLRWRAGPAVYAELHLVTLHGDPAVKMPRFPDDPPTLFGLPLVRDIGAPPGTFEIEAKAGDVWIMVLQGKVSGDNSTTYPVSPFQSVSPHLTQWPYEDMPGGVRVWTDVLQAPIDGLVAPEALPRVAPEHTDLMMPAPAAPPPVMALDENRLPVAALLRQRHFRRERWRNGAGDLVWLWRRLT